MGTNGLEMFSERRLQLLKETTAGQFAPAAVPRLMHSLKSTYANQEVWDSLMPQGFNATAWTALLQEMVMLNNSLKPDYGQMDVLMEMLCGAPTETDTSTAGQTTYTYILPLTGSRPVITYTGEFGKPTSAQQMLYSLLQTFEMDITRGNAPAISGSANMLFLKPGQDNVRMSAGTNEVQTITITGAPTGGTFNYIAFTDDVDIPYNATAAQAQTLIEGLSDVGAGNVLVTGGPAPATDLVVTFIGKFASSDVALGVVDGTSLSGGTTPDVSIAETTAGAAGDWALDPRYPMLPQHFTVKKASSLAGLASATPLGTVHKITMSHTNLASAFMFFHEGEITADSHVDGDTQTHDLTIIMAYDTDGDCAALKAESQQSPSTPSWWEVAANHPGGVYSFKVQGYYSIGKTLDHTAVDNVYSTTFPLMTLINDELASAGTDAVMRFQLTIPNP